MKIDSKVLSGMLARLKPIITNQMSGTAAEQKCILVTKYGFTASNFEVGAHIPIFTDTDESFLIHAKTVDLLLLMPAGEVSINPDAKGALNIKCGKIKNRAQTLDAKGFPDAKRSDSKGSATIDADELQHLVEQTAYAAEPPPSNRPVLEYIHFHFADGKATAGTIDGFRGAIATGDAEGDCNFMLSAAHAKRMKSFGFKGQIKISIDDTFVTLKGETGDEMFFRLPMGDMMDMSKYLPQTKYCVRFPRREMIDALTRIREVNRDSGGDLERVAILDIHEDEIEFRGSTQTNDYHETITADSDCDIRIALNILHTLDALKHVPHDHPILCYDSNLTPMKITSDVYTVVITPSRLHG